MEETTLTRGGHGDGGQAFEARGHLLSTAVPSDATGEVARVLGCQNYYAVLEVPVTADENEVKKHFRKKMLLVHPDKNGGAPHSNEAFDRVKQAFAVWIRGNRGQTGVKPGGSNGEIGRREMRD